ncbi:hypothetical protein ABVC71_01180 [Prevotella amnii]|uniref:hypothetical protein n=1 Tax=Prevotella amnii TaxID=419005 RepID=UPI00336AD920
MKLGDAHNESAKAQTIVEQADQYATKHRILATFGNYMRKHNPQIRGTSSTTTRSFARLCSRSMMPMR